MKKNEAIVIFTLIAIMVIVLVIVIVNKNKKTEEILDNGGTTQKEEFADEMYDGTRVNTSSKLAETKKYNGLEISNITLTEKDNESVIKATVKNTTSQVKGDESITLVFKDKNGNTLTEVDGYLDTIQPGASVTLNIKASSDFANAYDYTVK